MRILVVDDEPQLRRALERALKLEGYEVALAEDGEQGLAAVADGRPDAIVLDVLMPKLDGLAACRALRSRARPHPGADADRPRRGLGPGRRARRGRR